jgi:hypothetical protein
MFLYVVERREKELRRFGKIMDERDTVMESGSFSGMVSGGYQNWWV